MVYLVVGGGLVGSYIASTLSKNGAKVLLKTRAVPRKEAVTVAMRAGVEMMSSLAPLEARLRCGDLPQLEAIFISTKTYNLREVAEQLHACGPVLRPRLATVGCFNGYVMGVERMFAEAVGGVFCKSLVPGGYTFKPDGSGFDVTNGNQRWSLLSRRVEVRSLSHRMSQLGIATVAGGFEADARKFLVNTTANLVSVIANTNCHGLVSDSAMLGRMRNLCRETVAVLLASPCHSAHMPRDIALEDLVEQVLSAITAYGPHYPSSCKDFRAGKAIEVDSLNGYVCALGQQLGMATPFNQAVVDDIGIVVQQADSLLSDSLATPPPPAPSQQELRAQFGGRRCGGDLPALGVLGLPQVPLEAIATAASATASH